MALEKVSIDCILTAEAIGVNDIKRLQKHERDSTALQLISASIFNDAPSSFGGLLQQQHLS